jgi:hypothetical protein
MLQDAAADTNMKRKDGKTASIIGVLMELGTQKGLKVEAGKDYGAEVEYPEGFRKKPEE